MTVDFPWQLDGRGRTALTDEDDHIRDLIEQVLFTTPRERVMRPDFGSGLLAMVFEPGGPEAAAAAQYLVQSALERELVDLIAVQVVEVEAIDAAIVVTVSYVVRRTQTQSVATFSAPSGAP
jgi:phage baseplate assembly protein W